MTEIEKQRRKVQRLFLRAEARRNKPGWNIRLGKLQVAKNELIRMELDANEDN